jgi:hypothetical protein
MSKPKMLLSVQFLFRVILGGMLIFAGILKLIDNTTLFESVAYITWLPIWAKSLIINWLPYIEIAIGALLISHLMDFISIPVSALIYLSFFIFAVWGMSSGLEIDCGCFGDLDNSSIIGQLLGSELGWKMTIRNGIFTLMSFFLFWKPVKP